MAIDSVEKRKSISGIMLAIAGVTPNAAKDAEWRQEAGRSYSGIAAGLPVIVIGGNIGMQQYRDARRRLILIPWLVPIIWVMI